MLEAQHAVVNSFVESGFMKPPAGEYTTCDTGDCTNLAVAGNKYCHPCLEFIRAIPRVVVN